MLTEIELRIHQRWVTVFGSQPKTAMFLCSHSRHGMIPLRLGPPIFTRQMPRKQFVATTGPPLIALVFRYIRLSLRRGYRLTIAGPAAVIKNWLSRDALWEPFS